MLGDSLQRTFISCFIVSAASLIHGLLACAIAIAVIQGNHEGTLGLRAISVAFVAFSLFLLLLVEGRGALKPSVIRLIFWGLIFGLLLGIVEGVCLNRLPVLMNLDGRAFSQDSFSGTRILGYSIITIPVLVCAKAVFSTVFHVAKSIDEIA